MIVLPEGLARSRTSLAVSRPRDTRREVALGSHRRSRCLRVSISDIIAAVDYDQTARFAAPISFYRPSQPMCYVNNQRLYVAYFDRSKEDLCQSSNFSCAYFYVIQEPRNKTGRLVMD